MPDFTLEPDALDDDALYRSHQLRLVGSGLAPTANVPLGAPQAQRPHPPTTPVSVEPWCWRA